jgi:hypothetical protein
MMAHAIGTITRPTAGLMVAMPDPGAACFSSFEGLRASKPVQQMVFLACNQASSSADPSTFLQIQSVATVCIFFSFFPLLSAFFLLLLDLHRYMK